MNDKNTSKSKKEYVYKKPARPRRLGTGNDIAAWRETKRKGAISPDKLPDTYLGIVCEYVIYDIPDIDTRKRIRGEFAYVRKEFLKHLAEEYKDDLKKEGFSSKQLATMRKGMCPKGYNIHHKLPIHGGGKNDFDNLCIVIASPVHEHIHNQYINPQIRGMNDGEKRQIKIPKPAGIIIYTPENLKNTNINKKVTLQIVGELKRRAM
ncbi:MAG: hypothetical protein AB7U85_03175 [Alphaproteobacteria bacterium]